jgi:hypothetical protein
MIKCKLVDLIERCQQRGYTLDEVSNCILKQEGTTIYVDEKHEDYPTSVKGKGLGDIISTGLSKLGITPERVSKAIKKPCGCNKRKKKLNAVGEKLGIGKAQSGA